MHNWKQLVDCDSTPNSPTEFLCTKKAVPFLGKVSQICSIFKGVKVILKTLKWNAAAKKRETKLPQMPEMISHLSWRVIGTGDTGRMGFLSWSLHPFISTQVKRKATFNSSPNQALCTSSNILGAHLSRQTPAQSG